MCITCPVRGREEDNNYQEGRVLGKGRGGRKRGQEWRRGMLEMKYTFTEINARGGRVRRGQVQPPGELAVLSPSSLFFFSLIVNSGPFEQKTTECPLSRSALLHFLSLKCPSLVDCDCYYIRNSQFRETQRQWQRSDTRGRNAPRPKAATFSTKHLLQSPGLWAPARFNTGYY